MGPCEANPWQAVWWRATHMEENIMAKRSLKRICGAIFLTMTLTLVASLVSATVLVDGMALGWDEGAPGVTVGVQANKHKVTVIGGTSSSTDGQAEAGTPVTIVANDPKDGQAFVQWHESYGSSVTPVALASYDSGTTTFTMPDRDVTFDAVFKKILIEGVETSYPYTGEPIEPMPKVSLDGVDQELILNTNYTLEYSNNLHTGTDTAAVTVKMTGDKGSASKTFDITKQSLTVTADSAKRAYNGKALTASYTSTGLVENDKITSAEMPSSQTDVGKTANEVKSVVITNADGSDSTGDYNIEYKPGTLEVTPYTDKVTVKVEGKTATVPYNGSEQKVEGYDVKPSVEFYKATNVGFKGMAIAKGTAVGTYPMGLAASDFSNTSGNFTNVVFELTDGKLTIDPAPTQKATLSFDLAGGTLDGKSGTVTIEATVGDTIKLPAAPTRPGYTFVCWKGSEYEAGAEYKVEGDHSFTAEWSKGSWPIPTMSNSKDGNFASVNDEITYTIQQPVPDYANSLYTWVDLEGVLAYTVDADSVTVSTSDGAVVGRDVAAVSINGQQLAVTVADATSLRGKTLVISYRAKVRDGANLDSYLNAARTIASVPYQAHTVFDGDEAGAVSSVSESVKFRVSGSSQGSSKTATTGTATGSSTGKSTLASTSDMAAPTPVAVLAASGVAMLGIAFISRKGSRASR